MITIEKDFDNEMRIAQSNSSEYPFLSSIIDNTEFRDLLFDQFKNLDPKPKESVYIGNRMDVGALKIELQSNRPQELSSMNIVAAKSIPILKYENEYYDLSSEFYKNLNNIDTGDYGRNLKETDIVVILKEVQKLKNLFETKNISDKKDIENICDKISELLYLQPYRKVILEKLLTGLCEFSQTILFDSNPDLINGYVLNKLEFDSSIRRHLIKTPLESNKGKAPKFTPKHFNDFFKDNHCEAKFYEILKTYKPNEKTIVDLRNNYRIKDGKASELIRLIDWCGKKYDFFKPEMNFKMLLPFLKTPFGVTMSYDGVKAAKKSIINEADFKN